MSGVWAYIAEKDGYWVGVIAADLAGPKETASFISKYIRNGFSVVSLKNREEYEAKLAELKPYSESPEWASKHARKSRRPA